VKKALEGLNITDSRTVWKRYYIRKCKFNNPHTSCPLCPDGKGENVKYKKLKAWKNKYKVRHQWEKNHREHKHSRQRICPADIIYGNGSYSS
jgi:hypothetical protein